jgi:hypothetical protein
MNNIDAIFYINLKHRPQRKEWIESELSRMDFPSDKIFRIDAIYDTDCGHIGCCKSHIKAIETAQKMKCKTYLVFEDDFMFLISKDNLKKEFGTIFNEKWDVFMLSGFYQKDTSFQKDTYCRTTYASAPSGYIVREHYYEILKKCFIESLNIMQIELAEHKEKIKSLQNLRGRWDATRRNPGTMLQYNVTAIDRYWKKYQEKDIFLIFDPPVGKQNELFNGNYKGNDT